MKYKLQMEPEKVLEMIASSVARARNHVEFVEWSAEDGTRTEHDFLCRARRDRDQRRAPPPSTSPTRSAMPCRDEYRALFEMVRARVPNSDKAIFSVHCHNDLGLAVANSIAGVRGGARQIECTINGIGERAGNAALEEIVMALRTRADALPFTNNIDTTMLTRASKLVSAITSFPVQSNKAIVGRNAFAHESGIHQDGMLKNAHTYEIMTPESVGVAEDLAGDGQAFRPPRLQGKAEGTGLRAGRQRLWKTPSPASRIWPTARRSSMTRTSSPWSMTRSPPRMSASSSSR